jgi:hypothetical protein
MLLTIMCQLYAIVLGEGARGWGLGKRVEEELGEFVKKSVVRDTMKKYSYGWRDWCMYGDGYGWGEYYMTTATRTEKIRHLMNFFLERYKRGLRAKQATEAGAAVRKYFEIKLLSTEWFDDPQVKLARKSCRRSTDENREYVRSRNGKDKKPIWYDLLAQIREDLWEGSDYSCCGIDNKMVSINVMFSYDLALRRCEANRPGLNSENHTLLNEDLVFYLHEPVEIGGTMVDHLRGGSDTFRQYVVGETVKECLVARRLG